MKTPVHLLFVYFIVLLTCFFNFSSCRADDAVPCMVPETTADSAKDYKTRYVIVLIIDGPRYSETWGDSSHQYIPRMANDLAPVGIVCTNFYNDGITHTTSGHTALTTGFYQNINNDGKQIPQNPSIFQYYLQHTQKNSSKTWIITTKDKLEVLSDCLDDEFSGRYRPSTDCGTSGLGTGYRMDSTTFSNAKNILETQRPELALIQFREPDSKGHENNWPGYLQGIRDTDEYAWQIWNFLQNDEFYAGNTTLFVTNDHGRHLDNVKDGFVSHGDQCKGCTHINLFAAGPDFKRGVKVSNFYNQLDIPVTIGELMGFKVNNSCGKVLWEFFEK